VSELDSFKLSRRTLAKGAAATAAANQLAGVSSLGSVAAQDIPEVPRENTLILRWSGQAGRYVDHELWNGYLVASSHQNGLGLFHEPLAFYSAFADETIPWLAESWEYNQDYTELKIKLRDGISWSDGTPFTADDVAYTINTANEYGPDIKWGVNVQTFVDNAAVVDPLNVTITMKIPAPRFMFFMTYKYDIGFYIVPKHIFEGQDWTTFQNYDIAAGLPVTTAPWKLVFSSPEQKVIDRTDSWWAVDQGLVPALPDVQRIVYLPAVPDEQLAQQLIANEIDCSVDLRPLTIETVLMQNPSITTHTGTEVPYGYVDWWPTSLYVNNEREPYTDANVRWALSYFIDRDQIIQVALGGAGSTWPLPVPSYPGLQPFIDAAADLLEQYPTLEFNPDKGAELLTASGWAKNGDDKWEKDGTVLNVPIESFQVMADIGPVIVEQLKRQGVDASYTEPPDFFDRFGPGDWNASLFGHGGSIANDPYDTLALYQSVSVAVPGQHGVNFSRWHNDEYDLIVDEMAATSPDEQDILIDQWLRAMGEWLPGLPDIPIQEWYHRIPMNQTYWTGWPTAEDPYVNGAFWHLTFQLVLNQLKSTAAS
jgi:peptide/nickel transport system substrate-binding protein